MKERFERFNINIVLNENIGFCLLKNITEKQKTRAIKDLKEMNNVIIKKIEIFNTKTGSLKIIEK